MVFALQQTTCLPCDANGWRDHPWRNSTSSSKEWRAGCVRVNLMRNKGAILFVESAGSVICLEEL